MSNWFPEDKAWLKARKAQWQLQQVPLRRRYKAKDLKLLERWFLRGDEPLPRPFVNEWLLLGLHPATDPAVLEQALRDNRAANPSTVGRTPHIVFGKGFLDECALGGLFAVINIHSDYGIFNGRERYIVEHLLPKHFNRDTTVFPYTATELCKRFLDCALISIFYPGCNPYQPWQYLWQAWLECLHEPELRALDWVAGTGRFESQTRQLFRFIQRYIAPRVQPGSPAPLWQFCDALGQAIAAGGLPAEVQAAWAFVQSPAGWLDNCQAYGDLFSRGYLAQRTLHGAQADLACLEALVTLYHRLGFSEQGFDAQALKTVDFGPRATLAFAMDLGYALERAGDDEVLQRYDGVIPAKEYRVRTSSKFLGMPVTEDNFIDICLVVPERAAGFEAPEHTPWLLVYADYGPHYEHYRPPHEAMFNERAVYRAWAEARPERWLAYGSLGDYVGEPFGIDSKGREIYISVHGAHVCPLFHDKSPKGDEINVFYEKYNDSR